MREAGINYARVGDSIWASCEPTEGRFELDWLQRVLDALHEAGIEVVLATPTYAIPAWLARRYPEVMARTAGGTPRPFGARQNTDLANPTYRFYAERVTRKILERYAAHPSVIGFQVDNETGNVDAHNPSVFDAFVAWLREKYGSVAAVNETWGLAYWSHRVADWAELWPPVGNTNPGYDLDWRRFQAAGVTEFLTWQAGIVREYARDGQFVTHDVVGSHGRAHADRYRIAAAMDVHAENLPHAPQDGLLHPPVERTAMNPYTRLGAGPAQLYQRCDMAYGAKRSNFLITEMNPLSVGGSDNNFPEYDGQWRMAAFATISRGADMVAYWHWHSLHYGHETYSHGILNHDLEPNRCYDELATIGADLRDHGDELTGLTPEAEVAFLYSYDSKYALEFQPCLKTPDARPDRSAYARIFDACYRGFFDARAQALVLDAGSDVSGFPVVVAPALYAADEDTLHGLAEYAESGGHLVLTFRSGYADEFARARWQRAPGPLRAAAGVSYQLYSNLATPLGVRTDDADLELPAAAQATGWADELQLEGAQSLVTYDHPHFGRFPAVTSHRFGAGRVTYLGTLPNPALAKAIGEWALRQAGVQPLSATQPEPVRITTARTRAGGRLAFASNWSFDEHTVREPALAGHDLLADAPVPADGLRLGPWDIKVVATG